jgi:hypothetical protein
MRKLLPVLVTLFALGLAVQAQVTSNVARYLPNGTTDPNCARVGQIYNNTSTGLMRKCSAVGSPGTWADAGVVFTGGAVTSPVTFANGTAAAPSVAFTSDADGTGTGLFRSAANSIGFATNGTERWVINSSGSLNPATDNANDIGNGTVNPRDITASRNVTAKGSYLSPFVALADGATVTWDMNAGQNATVTLGGNRTLAITNAANGMSGCLIVTQDGTGGRTLTLPATSKVIGGGAGAITLTAAAGASDIICFATPNGTTFYWNSGLNFN